MRYFIRLAYNGGKYHGWQRQPNALSVQQVIEEALSTVLRHPAPITGAGRTDTGVNARTMYAHFDTDNPLDCQRIMKALNRLCGKEIAIYDLFEVNEQAHARFDATERTYKYFISYKKSPFLGDLSWHSPSILDIDKMNEAAHLLTLTDDFTSFAKLHSDAKTNICDVREARWEPLPGMEGIVFTIRADRFLRNMVRAVVGTLVDVGRGKLSIDDFRNVIADKNRCSAGTSMPAEALFLWDVSYPETIRI